MFFLKSSIGLYCTDTKLSVVSASGSDASIELSDQQSIDIPEGIIRNGVVQDVEKLVDALKSLQLSSKKIALCLPSDKVYVSQVTTAKSSGPRQKKLLDTAVAKVIPEESQELHVLYKKLHATKEEVTTGVIAIQKDIIEGYKEAATKAGLEIVHMTSLSAAVATYVGKKDQTSLLVQGVSSSVWTLTVLYKGWPIDEAVIPVAADKSALVKEANAMVDEFSEQGHPILSVDVIGDESLVQQVQSIIAAPTVKPEPVVEIPPAEAEPEVVEEESVAEKPEVEKKVEEKEKTVTTEEENDPPEEEESEEPGDTAPEEQEPAVAVQPIVEGANGVDPMLIEAAFASLTSSKIDAINFLKQNAHTKRNIFIGIAVLAVVLIGGAYLVRSFGYSIPIPFMAGEEGQTIIVEKNPVVETGSGSTGSGSAAAVGSSSSTVEIE